MAAPVSLLAALVRAHVDTSPDATTFDYSWVGNPLITSSLFLLLMLIMKNEIRS